MLFVTVLILRISDIADTEYIHMDGAITIIFKINKFIDLQSRQVKLYNSIQDLERENDLGPSWLQITV